MRKEKIFRVIFIVFFLRIIFLVLVPPFIGIANNGDFQRLMNSVGLDYAFDPWLEENYNKAFWNYVVNDFIFIDPIDNGWNQIFSVFPKIAIFLSNRILNGNFDIRFMGVVNACVYLLALKGLINNIKRIKGVWSYILLLAVCLVCGDSYILQYLNSFYTEIGSVNGIVFFWGLLVWSFLIVKNRSQIEKVVCIIVNSVAAIFAIMSKQQDILLIIPVVCIMWIMLTRFKFKVYQRVIWGVLFIAIIGQLFSGNKAGGNITAFNVIEMDILKHSENAEQHLKKMGFEENEIEEIVKGIGGNAFTGAVDIWTKYGENFTRGEEIKIFIREPQILWRMIIERR